MHLKTVELLPHLPGAVLVPRHAPGHELPQDDAKGVNVRGEGVTAAGQDFGRQPAWVGRRHAAQDCALFHDPRQVEVTHLHIDDTSSLSADTGKMLFTALQHPCRRLLLLNYLDHFQADSREVAEDMAKMCLGIHASGSKPTMVVVTDLDSPVLIHEEIWGLKVAMDDRWV